MQELKERFEKFLKKQKIVVNSFHPFFEEALNYMILSGGKRFRPLLLLGVVDSIDPLLIDSAMYPALAVEIFHTYSLIHDDLPVMDNANFRRGVETIHKKYDELTATLVGDGLNTYSFYLISIAPLSDEIRIELVKELSYNGGVNGMVLGQIIDCYFENKELDLERLKFLHIHKTAKLIAASLKMGAIILRDKVLQEKLYNIGLKMGLAFQIRDDIIDATKTTKEAGKDTGMDKNKNSFVNLLGLDGAKEALKENVEKIEKEVDMLKSKKLKNFLYSLINQYFRSEK